MLEPLKNSIAEVSEGFIDMVEQRLISLGYTIQEFDIWAVGFAIQKVADIIKNDCNISKIPNELYTVAVDMVCGEFLFAKKNSGQLQGFDVDIETVPVKQVHEGDTTVTFAVGDGSSTLEQRLDAVIKYLMTNGKKRFVKFRRLAW